MRFIVSKTILVSFLILFQSTPAHCGAALKQAFEWPLSPPTLFLQGGVNAVAQGGDRVFWAVGDTVAVVQKADGSVAATLRLATGTAIQDMLYDDTTAILYVAAGYDTRANHGGLQVVSMADPSSPSLLTVIDTAGGNPGAYRESDTESVDVPDIDARGLGLYQDNLFLADDNFGLRVFDVSDPSAPVEIPLADQDEDRISGYKQPDINGSYMATGGYVNLQVYPYDDKVYAFVLDFYHGIKVFDVTDPTVIEDPYLKDTRTNIWFGSVSLLSDLFVTETGGRLTAYVTGTNATGTESVVSRLDASVENGFSLANLGRCILPGEARSLSVEGDYAFVADGSAGLSVVDIAGVPGEDGKVLDYALTGSYTTDVGLAYGISHDESLIYLASTRGGLIVLDPADPVSPSFVRGIDPFLTADDVAVSGDMTFLLDRDSGLRVFDGSEPSYLVLQGYLGIDENTSDVGVNGDAVYVGMAGGGIRVIDVSDPASPSMTAVTLNAPSPNGLAVSGNYLYVADGIDGLRVFDIRTPLSPSEAGTMACTGTAEAVNVAGSRAYVAMGHAGVDMFDVSDPDSPAFVATLTTDDARSVGTVNVLGQTFALVADGDSGLKVFDITTLPASLAASVTVLEDNDITYNLTAQDVRVLEDNAYVAGGEQGLWVFDLSDPTAPAFVARRSTTARVRETVPVLIDGIPYVTAAEEGAGLRMLYLYSYTDVEDTEDLVPTIDSGCFIRTAGSGRSSLDSMVKTRLSGWLTSVSHAIADVFLKTTAHKEIRHEAP